MHQVHFIQKLYSKFYPQSFAKGLKLSDIPKKWQKLPIEEKKKLANELLTKGEELLSKEDLSAIKLFNEAAQLDSTNPFIWYRQGLAFFEHGTHENNEKSLLLASKNFKIATSLDPEVFDFWWAWANVLFIIGANKEEHPYILDAKKKYKYAISLSKNQSKDTLAELFWDYGSVRTKIADHSGEAIDLKKAIEAFSASFAYQTDPSSAFLYDIGNAYLKMGLLINENNVYLEAIDYFKKAIDKSKKHLDAWVGIADSYTQLYINTMNEEYFNLANSHFEHVLELNPLDAELWLDWARLLGESGRINADTKKLRASIEKCIRSFRRNNNLAQTIGQWTEALSLLGAYTNRLDLIIEAENKIMKITDMHSEESELWHSYGICMTAFGIYYGDIEYDYFAIEKFQLGLSLDRTNAETWHAIANSHAKIGKEIEDIDMLERANKFYTKAIDLKPASPVLIFDYAKNLTTLGEFTAIQITLEEAVKQFEMGLDLQKNAILSHPEWLYYYGLSLDLLGDVLEKEYLYEKAIEIFNNVLLVEPDFPKIHFRLALCFTHLLENNPKQEYLERADNCFKLAIKQDQEDDEVWLEWGLMFISFAQENMIITTKVDYFQEAEQKIIKAGQLGNSHAYYHLACLYSLTNRLEDAIRLLEKAQKSNILPPIEEMLEDEWLDNLRASDLFSDFLYQLENKQKITEE